MVWKLPYGNVSIFVDVRYTRLKGIYSLLNVRALTSAYKFNFTHVISASLFMLRILEVAIQDIQKTAGIGTFADTIGQSNVVVVFTSVQHDTF